MKGDEQKHRSLDRELLSFTTSTLEFSNAMCLFDGAGFVSRLVAVAYVGVLFTASKMFFACDQHLPCRLPLLVPFG